MKITAAKITFFKIRKSAAPGFKWWIVTIIVYVYVRMELWSIGYHCWWLENTSNPAGALRIYLASLCTNHKNACVVRNFCMNGNTFYTNMLKIIVNRKVKAVKFLLLINNAPCHPPSKILNAIYSDFKR